MFEMLYNVRKKMKDYKNRCSELEKKLYFQEPLEKIE